MSNTNVATLPWMTSLQDTASNLQQAGPVPDTAPAAVAVPSTFTSLPPALLPTAAAVPVPFLGRVVPPAPAPFLGRAASDRMPLQPSSMPRPDPTPQSSSLTLSRVVQTNTFKHVIAVICVFIISLVLLIIIQPPFTYTTSKEKYKRGHFSVGIAALYALGAACVSAGAMTAVYFATRKRI